MAQYDSTFGRFVLGATPLGGTADGGANSFAANAWLAGSFTVDAVAVPKFTLDAVLLKEVTVAQSSPISYISTVNQGSDHPTNPSWTHTPSGNARTLVVFAGAWNNSIYNWITYGNQSLTRQLTITGNDSITIWVLEDISGRDDNVIRTSGYGCVASMMFGADVPIHYAGNASTGYANHNGQNVIHSLSSGTYLGGAAVAHMAGISGGNWDPYATAVQGATQTVSFGGVNEGWEGAYETGDQPIAGGYYFSTSVNTALGSVLLATDVTGVAIDAVIVPSFSLDAVIVPVGQDAFLLSASILTEQAGSVSVDSIIGTLFSLDALIQKTQVSQGDDYGLGPPSVYGGALIGSLFTTGAGSRNWTATPGSDSDFVVDFNSRDQQYADFSNLAYGGVTPTDGTATSYNPYGFPNVSAHWWDDISGRASDSMTHFNTYNDGQHWVSVATQRLGTMFIADQTRAFYASNSGSKNITVDPDGRDCVALIWQSTGSTSYIPGVPTIDNGRTISALHYRVNEGHSSRLHVVDVLASDGSTVITSPNVGSERGVVVLLIAADGGGPPVDAWVDAGFRVDALITDGDGLIVLDAFVQPYFRVDAVIELANFSVDAYFALPPSDFSASALISKTQRGDAPTVAYDSYVRKGNVAWSSDSWYHTGLDAAGILVIAARNSTTNLWTVTYGGVSVPFVVRAQHWTGDDLRMYAQAPLPGRDDTEIEISNSIENTDGFSVAFTSSDQRSLAVVGTASKVGTNSSGSLLDWVDGGEYGGICVLFGAETGIGTGHHLSPYGSGWTQIDQGAYEGFTTIWWKAIPAGKTQVGVVHSNYLSHNIRMAATVIGPSNFGFPLPLDAWVFDTRFAVDAFIDYWFTLDAYFYPYFQTDAVIIGNVEVDPGPTLDAWVAIGGDFGVDAVIFRHQTGLLHWDTMSATEVDTWGSPDVGYDYTYPQGGESYFDKAGGVGTFYDDFENATKYGVYTNDGASANKRMRVKAVIGHPSTNFNEFWFGLNSRVRINLNLADDLGANDYLHLQVDGVTVGTLGRLETDGPYWYEMDTNGTVVRARWWPDGDDVPDWQIEYDAAGDGYAPSLSSSYLRTDSNGWFGTGNGGPKIHQFDDWKIWIPGYNVFSVDAEIVLVTEGSTFTVDSRIGYWYGAAAFVQPYFRVDAETYDSILVYGRPAFVRAYITPPTVTGSDTIDAVIAARVSFPVDANIQFLSPTFGVPADAAIFGTQTGSFTIDALYGIYWFVVDALIGTRVTRPGFLVLRSWIDDAPVTKTFSGDDGWAIDAHIDGADGTIGVDAVIRELEETASFIVAASSAAAGEERGAFTLDATRSIVGDGRFRISAVSAQNAPLRLDAVIAGIWTLDAVLVHLAGSGSGTIDAWLAGAVTRTTTVRAVIADASGDYRGAHVDAVVLGTVHDVRLHYLEVLSHIIDPSGSFTIDAEFVRILPFTVDARIWQPIFVDAFIESDQFAIFPPSQEGDSGDTTGTAQSGSDGVAVNSTTFSSASADFTGLAGATIVIDGVAYVIESVTNSTTVVLVGGGITGSGLDWYIPTLTDPDASFDDSLIGSTIIIEGISYTIIDVVDEHTVIVGGTDEWPYANGGITWRIPSGDATDPAGDPPPTTLISSILIEWSRPDKEQWSDLTGDVIWNTAKFTEAARVGPGTFELTLKGAFSQFLGGEEIRVTIDGYRVFGGYVTDVDRGYAFDDDYAQPLTFLRGTDYNILLDRLRVYNAEWDAKKEGSGLYRTWKPFPKATLDSTIIKTVADRFMSDPGLMGLNMKTHVDTIETPAPTTGFQMESGMSIRNLLTEISRITEGIWYIDAYKNLHYHAREAVPAPYPITDGDGGIACRGLRITSSLDIVTNDVFVWGTAAYMDTGDSDIIYSRQTADQDWDVDWWTAKIAYVQAKIDAITDVPYGQRTLKQRTRLEALRKTRAVYRKYLANAQASTEQGSVERFGRWQYGEFRQDLYQQYIVDRRAKAIMQRYSEPVVKGEAVVFAPGYSAGQVVEVVSTRHDVADELPIREMTIDFVVSKEPVGGTYYAVPRYALSFGIDPEEPWDTYQFLPFPDFPNLNVHFNQPSILFEFPDPSLGGPYFLDTFQREWSSAEHFGEATNERDEDRYWELP